MVANQTGYIPRILTGVFADAHVYENHIEALQEQLERTPSELPTLQLTPNKQVFKMKFEDIAVVGYVPQPHIPMDVAV